MSHARPWVLGISASHNGACCLLHGDEIVAAVQEERLTGLKRQRIVGSSPSLAQAYCLQAAGITAAELAMVVVCVQSDAAGAVHDLALNPALRTTARGIPTTVIPHHLGHAVSALALSGWSEAAVLVVDGVGSREADLGAAERDAIIAPVEDGHETTSLYHGRGTELRPLEKHLVARGEWMVPRGSDPPRYGSLGGLFSAVAHLMFGDAMEAGKVMGLAPYGTPRIPPEAFFSIVDGRFEFADALLERYRGMAPWPAHEAEYRDLAASIQRALEEALLHLARRARARTGSERLCYAGGVALNSVANERLARETGFQDLFIPPAAEDSGPAIGAAFHGLWALEGGRTHRALGHDAMGAVYDRAQIDAAIRGTPAVARAPLGTGDVYDAAVERLVAGEIGGWFQGRSELGPRALGQRSILCDPRRPDGKDVLNRRVKHREGFRPFAPAILLEETARWFEVEGAALESPYMLRVRPFRPERRAAVPAVVHEDGTGRVQTLTAEANGTFHALVRRFFERTGVPILLNTSYNVMGEPIVETPGDALWDLLATGLDFCVLEDVLVVRAPGYRSPLDLYPSLRASACTLTLPVDEGVLELDVPSEGRALLRVATPWGETDQAISTAFLPLLQQIDGRRSGWDLLEWAARQESPLDAAELTSVLSRLRRRHVLSFSDAAR